MASFRAQLSPNEETTLCRIAAGTTDVVREADAKRLIALGLVAEFEGKLTATKVGLERCPFAPTSQRLRAASESPPASFWLKAKDLPARRHRMKGPGVCSQTARRAKVREKHSTQR
jgi:hypothetical protein